MLSLGQRVKRERLRLALSQPGLARSSGLSYQALQQIENGSTKGTKYLVPIAKTLGVTPEWLETGRGEKSRKASTVPVVGYAGAGTQIFPIDDHAKGDGLDHVPAAPIDGDCVGVIVRGDSLYPVLRDGWLVFYKRDQDGVPDDCIGKICVVRVKDGPTLVKEVFRGSKKGHYTLKSWNAAEMPNVRLSWASPVIDIRPK